MRRPVGVVVALAITAVACGEAAASQPAPPAVPTTERATNATAAPVVVSQPVGTPAGPAAPDFLMELNGGDIYVLSRDQKPVYLVFWAEWCPTCRRELPVIDRIAADYRDDVTFLAVAGRGSLDRTEERAVELFSDNLLWGLDESIWELYAVFGQPFTVLVSGDDVIVDSWFGRLDESELRDKVEGLIAASA